MRAKLRCWTQTGEVAMHAKILNPSSKTSAIEHTTAVWNSKKPITVMDKARLLCVGEHASKYNSVLDILCPNAFSFIGFHWFMTHEDGITSFTSKSSILQSMNSRGPPMLQSMVLLSGHLM